MYMYIYIYMYMKIHAVHACVHVHVHAYVHVHADIHVHAIRRLPGMGGPSCPETEREPVGKGRSRCPSGWSDGCWAAPTPRPTRRGPGCIGWPRC